MVTPADDAQYTIPPQVSFDWLSRAWTMFIAHPWRWMLCALLLFIVWPLFWLAEAIPTGNFTQAYILYKTMYQVISSGGRNTFTSPTPAQNIPINVLFTFISSGTDGIVIGGLFNVALHQLQTGKVEIKRFFGIIPLIPAVFVIGLVKGIPEALMLLAPSSPWTFLYFIPKWVMGGLLMFSPLIAIERKAGPLQSIADSFKMLKRHWPMATVYYIFITIIAWLGFLFCGVGAIATYPISLISIAIGYIAFAYPVQAAPRYGPAVAGVWPPPPNSEYYKMPLDNVQPPPFDVQPDAPSEPESEVPQPEQPVEQNDSQQDEDNSAQT